jgi:D-glycero-D-manno-heptose 1,7-bisphosphate phosphatase
MARAFLERGGSLAGVFHCPYLPGATVPGYDRDSFWRKPNPGMILEAARRLDLDLARSIFLGDQPGDMTAASAAGVGGRVLICSDPSSAAANADLVIRRLGELTVRLPWGPRARRHDPHITGGFAP